jgi:hypothetical protein
MYFSLAPLSISFALARVRSGLVRPHLQQIGMTHLFLLMVSTVGFAFSSRVLLCSQDFLEPVRQSFSTAKPIMEIQDIPSVFSNIEDILGFHNETSSIFESIFDNFPYLPSVGRVFLDLVRSFQFIICIVW